MFVVHYHNEHAFDNPGDCAIYGPYETLEQAKSRLALLVGTYGDPLFRIDPDPEATDSDGTYAGYYYKELLKADRDEDLACEVWAFIQPIDAGF
jgi:hypothetical protein